MTRPKCMKQGRNTLMLDGIRVTVRVLELPSVRKTASTDYEVLYEFLVSWVSIVVERDY